ncbi:maltose ABC transporter substrate-binding protein [Xylanimonas protaetiae]|uniref:Maltodextrin-binding protein n=2 Tax=Xylanimonas protaetiae TaxID=2509457 RepID=A0A4P6F8Q4_9MICO|nr:maltose ABC transporter substrate-binding protein [Xylanimonas protaetiae]
MLTACGGGSDTPPSAGDNTAGGDDAAPVTLKVWESLQGPDEFIKQAGEAFTKEHPNVTVEFVNVEVGDAAGQIALDGPAGTGPDVFVAPHDKIGELVSGGHILPVANPDAVKANVLPAAATGATYDGTLYGYPVAMETYALYYNKDLIPEAPTTWDEVASFAETFNAANPGKYGFVMDVGNGYYTILFTTSGDNRLFGPDGDDTANTNINSAASAEGMAQFAALRPALNVAAADLDTATVDALFAAGNAAMHVSGPWNVSAFTDAGINFGVAPLPSLTAGGDPAASFAGVRTAFVSAYTEHEEEAAAFAEFLTTPEMQQLRADITGALASSSSDITYKNDLVNGFADQMKFAFPMPSIPQMSKFWDAMNAASANIWNGADIQTELDAANAAMLAQ